MVSILWAAACVVSLAATASGDRSPRLEDIKLDVRRLADESVRTYQLRAYIAVEAKGGKDRGGRGGTGGPGRAVVAAREAGTLTLSTRVEGGEGEGEREGEREGGRGGALLEDVLRLRVGAGVEGGRNVAARDVVLTRRAVCRLDAVLSPVEVVTQTQSGDATEDELKESALRFEAGRVMLKRSGGAGEVEVSKLRSSPVSVSAVLRLAGQWPRGKGERGERWAFDHLVDLASPTLHTAERGEAFAVVCVGPETVRVAGREVACVRHEVHTGGEGDTAPSVTLWTDDEGVLWQAMFGRELRATLGAMEPVEEDPYLRARLRGE